MSCLVRTHGETPCFQQKDMPKAQERENKILNRSRKGIYTNLAGRAPEKMTTAAKY